jgi:hypothetical protein
MYLDFCKDRERNYNAHDIYVNIKKELNKELEKCT